jgi:plastocyanin
MKRIGLIMLAVFALAAAGCGSSSDNTSSTPSTPASTGTSSTASSGGGNTVTIDMKNIAFNPSSATAKVGDTIKWVNQDSAPHNVTGGPLHSPTIGNGASFTYKATKAGTISYVCTIHPGMKATLTITS